VSKRRSVRVDLGANSYPIVLGHDTLSAVGEAIVERTSASQAVLISVPPVNRRYGATVARSLREAGLRVQRLVVPDGDATKNLRQVAKLYDALVEKNTDRSAVVVSLGGGMVSDLAGFVAATYLRGIRFVTIPTTVLAMVDAGVGGKVGVNLKQGKNLVGAFHQPRLVWVDTATLRSLPRRDRAAGLAEVVKAGAIWDADYFEMLERAGEKLLELDPELIVPVLERACEIKAEVVSRDERESNLRMQLNFGHTLAHAVESLKRYRGILHGEAVAIGMVFAAGRSEELGLAPQGTAERVTDLLRRLELPTQMPDFARGAYLRALKVDKKKKDAHIRFVVLREIGRAETHPLTPAEILPAGWRSGAAKEGRA
jgi:3-dehydroquinate synthase